MNVQINLVTLTDCQNFAEICSKLDGRIELYSPKNRYKVNGKSLLGALAAVEWNDLWVDSDEDITDYIMPYLLNKDSAKYHD